MARKIAWQESAVVDYNAIAEFLLLVWNEKVLADFNVLLSEKTAFLLSNPGAGKLVEQYQHLRSVVIIEEPSFITILKPTKTRLMSLRSGIPVRITKTFVHEVNAVN